MVFIKSALDKTIKITGEQEELLVFPRFSRKDAWELGHLFAEIITEKKLSATICIRLLSGQIVFQWAEEGTNANNDYWMIRKFHLVREMEMSSLRLRALFKKQGDTLESWGLDPQHYAVAGGGFPIRVKDSGLVAVVTISGLHEVDDHILAVEGISEYLGIKDIPQLSKNTGI